MEFSLSHISMLIELTEKEINQLKQVIDNPDSSDEEVDDSGELSTQYLSLSSALASAYKNQWSPDSNYPDYEKLIARINDNL